jgi:hypothetical protein
MTPALDRPGLDRLYWSGLRDVPFVASLSLTR